MDRFIGKTKIKLHHAAKSAYSWMNNYPYLLNSSKINSGLIEHLSRQPLLGVFANPEDKKRSDFLMFSPLWQVKLWQGHEPPLGTLLINVTDINDAEIEKIAWTSVLSHFICTIDHKKLSEIRENINKYLPKNLCFEFFEKGKFTDPILCNWIACSRATLTQQRKKNKDKKAQISSNSPSNIIEYLSGSRNKDDKYR